MATVKLVLTKPLNVSLQAKTSNVSSTTANIDNGAWDIVYFIRMQNDKQIGDIYRLGKCISITPDKNIVTSTEVDSTTTYIVGVEADVKAQTPNSSDYIFFGKENKVCISGVKGYYAEVEMKNDSTKKAELFSVGSEMIPSSK
tara:strand:+ start:1356 stop:1784 length:429 start_codon:yes stop_codon:yes gene_type:complete